MNAEAPGTPRGVDGYRFRVHFDEAVTVERLGIDVLAGMGGENAA